MAVQSGLARVKSNLASGVKKGKMTQEAADAVMQRVKGTLDYSDFRSVDMVRPADLQPLPPAACTMLSAASGFPQNECLNLMPGTPAS